MVAFEQKISCHYHEHITPAGTPKYFHFLMTMIEGMCYVKMSAFTQLSCPVHPRIQNAFISSYTVCKSEIETGTGHKLTPWYGYHFANIFKCIFLTEYCLGSNFTELCCHGSDCTGDKPLSRPANFWKLFGVVLFAATRDVVWYLHRRAGFFKLFGKCLFKKGVFYVLYQTLEQWCSLMLNYEQYRSHIFQV